MLKNDPNDALVAATYLLRYIEIIDPRPTSSRLVLLGISVADSVDCLCENQAWILQQSIVLDKGLCLMLR